MDFGVHFEPATLGQISLGNSWMMLWASAVIIPILIHVIAQRRRYETPWAAMQFLIRAVRRKSRRLSFEQLCLLLVRILLLAVLAVALAEPVWTSSSPLAAVRGVAGGRTVIVIDNSFSMAYDRGNGTRLDRAKAISKAIVQCAAHGHVFDVIPIGAMTQQSWVRGKASRDRVLSQIDSLPIAHTRGDLAASLRRIRELLGERKTSHDKEASDNIIVVTDLGYNTWREVQSEPLKSRLLELSKAASIRIVDVGHPDAPNLEVTALGTSDALIFANQRAAFEFAVRNHGNRAVSSTAELLVEEVRVDRVEFEIPAGGELAHEMHYQFERAGNYGVELRLDSDPLPIDNNRYLFASVRDSVRVLCIGDDDGAARNVAFALQPDVSDESRIVSRITSVENVWASDLSQYDSLFLCNVSLSDTAVHSEISDYVKRGGSLIVFFGDQFEDDVYRQMLQTVVNDDLENDGPRFPIGIDSIAPEGDYRFDPKNYDHQIAKPFRDFENSGLLTTPIWRYVRMTPSEKSALAGTTSAHVALWFSTGDPAIVDVKTNRGKVVLVATSPDEVTATQKPWSAMSAWPSFVPLVHELLDFALSRESTNLMVGEAATGIAWQVSNSTAISVIGPDGGARIVPIQTSASPAKWAYDRTRRSGIYRIEASGARIDPGGFAVNVETLEGSPRRLDVSLLPPAINILRSDVQPEASRTLSGPPRLPLYRLALLAALTLVILESIMAWQMGRDRG